MKNNSKINLLRTEFSVLKLTLLVILLWPRILNSQTIEKRSGGGNLNNGILNAANIERINTLENTGATMVRINLYPNDYWNFSTNTPKIDYADQLMLYLAEKNIRVVILFEHYAYFPSLGQPLGNYNKWFQIGEAFANRYKPGSTFFVNNGFSEYGIEYYTAINEPDIGDYMPKTILEGPENYHDAIEGLADGVHASSQQLKVIPGGFASENSANSHTLNGFGTAIADLFNNGKLYGIDLHTYNDLNYAPILKYDNTNHVEFMAFYDFSQVKLACGITADIKFCPTEFSFKENTQGIDNSLAAKRQLTCIWGNLGAVMNDGSTSATEYALIWNIYNTIFEDPIYGTCLSQTPYNPTLKGQTFNLVLDLVEGMDFVHLDPFGRGEYILESTTKKMWVFQNYDLLSNVFGSNYTIEQIPSNTTEILVYNWTGLLYTIQNANYSTYTISGLSQNETYMIVAQTSLNTNSEIDLDHSSINLFPNPFNESAVVKTDGEKFQVFDSHGVFIEAFDNQKPQYVIGENYIPGVYFIEFDSGRRQKIIKT